MCCCSLIFSLGALPFPIDVLHTSTACHLDHRKPGSTSKSVASAPLHQTHLRIHLSSLIAETWRHGENKRGSCRKPAVSLETSTSTPEGLQEPLEQFGSSGRQVSVVEMWASLCLKCIQSLFLGPDPCLHHQRHTKKDPMCFLRPLHLPELVTLLFPLV